MHQPFNWYLSKNGSCADIGQAKSHKILYAFCMHSGILIETEYGWRRNGRRLNGGAPKRCGDEPTRLQYLSFISYPFERLEM